MHIIKCENYAEVSARAARLIAAQVVVKPDCVLGLATGSSPIGAYQLLQKMYADGKLDFSAVTSVNLDEYCNLSTENEQSYRYFMNDNLFDHINIDKAKTFVPDGLTSDPVAEGEAYDARIKALGGIDLQLLGIGGNGHIGFNEPADEFIPETHVVTLDESTRLANARFFTSIDEVPTHAITMGMASIMQAKKVLLIAGGKKKAEIIEKAFFGPVTPFVPASILQLHPDVTVIYTESDN